jgi:fumarate hydratase subunit beta
MKPAECDDNIIKIVTPVKAQEIEKLAVGTKLEIHGTIYCGRDAVLPKLVELIEDSNLNRINLSLKGTVIFHTAVSPAGIGPTTSNKVEIEKSIPTLSKAGVKIHVGKGSLSQGTAEALNKYNAVFAVTPPVSAVFSRKIVSSRVVAFKKEGMEALFEMVVKGFPAIVAIAHGKSIYHGPETQGA